MSDDWFPEENAVLVADYLSMLAAELRGESYSKTAHRLALTPHLKGRSKGSVEFKHQNVSAVLIDLGYPYIEGYKPRFNYQTALFEAVADQVSADLDLRRTVSEAVEASAKTPFVRDLLDRMEEPPDAAAPNKYATLRERKARSGINWLEIESRNHSLGRAGEEFVLRFERARLLKAGEDRLADRVEHVSLTVGDGEGFDIRSFEASGKDRLIEVKTTAYGKLTPFFLSRNELRISKERAAAYHLYRLFRFREDPRLYGLQGALDETCLLDPVQFSARVKRSVTDVSPPLL